MKPRPETSHFQYIEHGIVHVDPPLHEDETLIYLGSPSHTVTPYDVYARYIVKAAVLAFKRAQIDAEVVTCHRRRASVGFGTGPGGSVRFGDDMIPPDVQAIVHTVDAGRALKAWGDYHSRRFFYKPVSVIGNKWYDRSWMTPCVTCSGGPGGWREGGTWPHVITNAIAIARHIGQSTEKLEAYAKKKKIPYETSDLR